MIDSFDKLREFTRQKIKISGAPKMAVLPPFREQSMQAASKAITEKWVNPVFFGTRENISKELASCGIAENEVEIFETESNKNITLLAIEQVQSDKIDFIMAGDIIRKDLVDVLGSKEAGFVKRGDFLSHVALLQTPKYHKLMFLTDAIVNCQMDAAVKIKVTQNAAKVASGLGINPPKAALLAAVEAIYPAMPVTMEEAAIAKMSDRGLINWAVIDGPLSFDVAISADVARSKGVINSKVAGETDIFVAPTIETANGVLKAMLMYVKAETAGIITGGRCPVVAAFVIDPVEDIVNSIVLAACLTID